MTESVIANSQEYQSFRSSVPLKTYIVDDDDGKEWKLYDAGPKQVKCPIICFPPASGTSDVFYKQLLALSAVGYRVISVEYPVYWTMGEFCDGFKKLLDHLQLDKVHIFGTSLGGFLAQKFAEVTHRSPRVVSLILCNAFYDTTIFNQTNSAPTFWMMPALVLKKMVMGNFDRGYVDTDICDSIDFLVERLDSLSQSELASRLTLNCMNCYIEPQKLQDVDVTIMDVFDDCALSHAVREEMYKCYPEARRAHLKSGGNFPYLSRSGEVNIFIQIHLQKYDGTSESAKFNTDKENSDSETFRRNCFPWLQVPFFSWSWVAAECKTMSNCCQTGRSRKIGPECNDDVIELRPRRHLRIQHLNARRRDSALEQEQQLYLKNHNISYTNYGKLTSSINQKKTPRDAHKSDSQNDHIEANHPNMAKCQEEKTIASRPTSFNAYSSPFVPSRSSLSRDSVGGETIMSSSNVEVSLNLRGNEDGFMSEIEEKDEQSNATSRSLKSFVSEPVKNNGVAVPKDGAIRPDPGVVLFFIHGVGGSSDIWKPQMKYFANLGYEIICPDMIGHGLSCAPNDRKCYHFREILRDMEAMFDVYCKRSNVIIGHSYGCAFATVLARQRAKRVTKLILVSGGGPVPLAPQPGVFSLPICILACIKPCISCLFTRGAFHNNSKLLVDKQKAFDIPTYVLDFIMNGQWWLDGDDLYHSCINVSTLLIWGRHDKFVSLEEEEAMDKTIVDCKLEIIEETGHMVMMEAPEHFNNIVHQFIAPGVIKGLKDKLQSEAQYTEVNSSHVPGVSHQQSETDRTTRASSPWFSPRRKRPDSSKSKKSITSIKSSKSRKSMPNGVLTHSLL
ncbi:uncharacterized protein LOC125651303 [Ostrea edulis]|uniref:uncharacterized protein LOC125651303 n=1 Tax=Ostrea edulis TaxID=37623 RepID=UPI00209534AA|nr:uncharacterized protein LOC125651303 [Ostrea edulis]